MLKTQRMTTTSVTMYVCKAAHYVWTKAFYRHTNPLGDPSQKQLVPLAKYSGIISTAGRNHCRTLLDFVLPCLTMPPLLLLLLVSNVAALPTWRLTVATPPGTGTTSQFGSKLWLAMSMSGSRAAGAVGPATLKAREVTTARAHPVANTRDQEQVLQLCPAQSSTYFDTHLCTGSGKVPGAATTLKMDKPGRKH